MSSASSSSAGTTRFTKPAAFRRTTHERGAVEHAVDEAGARPVDEDEAPVESYDYDDDQNRSYRDVGGSVVVDVADTLVADNNRTWRISSDGVELTDDHADVSVDVATMSALYLGGVSWSALAAMGDVAVHDDGQGVQLVCDELTLRLVESIPHLRRSFVTRGGGIFRPAGEVRSEQFVDPFRIAVLDLVPLAFDRGPDVGLITRRILGGGEPGKQQGCCRDYVFACVDCLHPLNLDRAPKVGRV